MSTEQDTGDDLFSSPSVNVLSPEEAKAIAQGDKKVLSDTKAAPKKSVIRPVSGSRMLTRVANILDHQIEGKDAEGNTITESLGTYTGERFKDSRQNMRPEYDSDLGQFDIRKPDGSLWTQEDANNCLKQFPLTYEAGHPRENEPITTCDIFNVADPYFNHRGFVRFLEEGELALNMETRRDEILQQVFAGNGEVAFDTGDEYYPGDTRYLITNPDAQEHRVEKKMTDTLDAMQEFVKMQDNRKRMIGILRLFGVDPQEDASLITLRLELYKYVNDDSTLDEGATYQQRFLTYVKLSDAELELREVIAQALNTGEIRTRSGAYMYLDVNIGRMYSQVVDHFRKNPADYDDLKERVKKK